MQAKLIASQNKVSVAKNELENAKIQLSTIQNEYLGKIAKSESEKFSTLSDQFEAEGSVSNGDLTNTLRNPCAHRPSQSMRLS